MTNSIYFITIQIISITAIIGFFVAGVIKLTTIAVDEFEKRARQKSEE